MDTCTRFSNITDLFQQVAYPRLSKICPIVMRARGVLLIKDAVNLREEFERQSEVPKQVPSLVVYLREVP